MIKGPPQLPTGRNLGLALNMLSAILLPIYRFFFIFLVSGCASCNLNLFEHPQRVTLSKACIQDSSLSDICLPKTRFILDCLPLSTLLQNSRIPNPNTRCSELLATSIQTKQPNLATASTSHGSDLESQVTMVHYKNLDTATVTSFLVPLQLMRSITSKTGPYSGMMHTSFSLSHFLQLPLLISSRKRPPCLRQAASPAFSSSGSTLLLTPF